MIIGAMNSPAADPLQEIEFIASLGLEFVDLTLEPPGACSWKLDPDSVISMLRTYHLSAVGHTAYYLPIANPFEEIRCGAVTELKRCIQFFAQVGVKWMNVHPDRHAPFHSRDYVIEQNLRSLTELLEAGKKAGVGIMVENIPGDFNNAEQLAELLDPLPELGLHLDIGHCNLMVTKNTTVEILERFSDRLQHVHLHDNKGGHADLHMPLGTGTVNTRESVQALRKHGYDGSITLEVFTPDKRHVLYSRDLLRRLWDEDVSGVSPRLHPVSQSS